jgi:hypothetical protein
MGTVLAYGDVAYAVPEERSRTDISVFPNPFISDLNISLPAGASGEVFLDWLDLSGRNLLHRALPVLPGTATVSISVPYELPSGFYLLRVTCEEKHTVLKVIKAK